MTAYPFTTEGLSGALAALGDEPAKVADTLLEGGHRGRPGCDASCPIAEYLGSFWPAATCSVTEDPPGGMVAEVWYSPSHTVTVPLPGAAREFVAAFDAGGYPDLDRTKAAAL